MKASFIRFKTNWQGLPITILYLHLRDVIPEFGRQCEKASTTKDFPQCFDLVTHLEFRAQHLLCFACQKSNKFSS